MKKAKTIGQSWEKPHDAVISGDEKAKPEKSRQERERVTFHVPVVWRSPGTDSVSRPSPPSAQA